jgi:hypothetical protein
MAMSYGAIPTSSDSVLTGMSLSIYTVMLPVYVTPGLTKINTAIAQGLDATEGEEAKADLIKQTKVMAYCIAKGVIDHIKDNMEIKGVKVELDTAIDPLTHLPSPRYLESYSGTVPDLSPYNNGGALIAGVTPVSGAVRDKYDIIATQNNDGIGLVE